MSWRLYIKGNLFIAENEQDGEYIDKHKVWVSIRKKKVTDEIYTVYYKDNVVTELLRDIPLTELRKESGANWTDATEFEDWRASNLGGFNSGGGETPAAIYNFTATNYTDLVTNVAPTANELDLARVYNSQGIWGINRKVSGAYIYKSGVWEYASQDLQDEIKSNDTDIADLQTNKVDKVAGKQLSTEDYTTAEKANLANQSGVNTGDETTATIQAKRPIKTLEGKSLEGSGNLQLPKASLQYEDGTTNTALTVNVWTFFEMTGATLDNDSVSEFEQLLNFPDTLVYTGTTPVQAIVNASLDLRRIGGGQNRFQFRLVRNGVQFGAIRQIELSGVDPNVSFSAGLLIQPNDQIWIEVRNTSDGDDILLLAASLTINT